MPSIGKSKYGLFTKTVLDNLCHLSDRLLLRDAEKFLMDDIYANPGPTQYKGPGADSKTLCLCVEDQDYMGRVKELQGFLDKVSSVHFHV